MSKRNLTLIAIGKTIRKLRLTRGYTQETFAAKANLDRAYYGSVERGERNISAVNLVRIALTLKVEVGELFPEISNLQEITDKSI